VIGVAALAITILSSIFGNKDDIFDLREMLLILNESALNNEPFFGQTKSNTQDFVIEGDGGRYDIFYNWELIGPTGVVPGDQDNPGADFF